MIKIIYVQYLCFGSSNVLFIVISQWKQPNLGLGLLQKGWKRLHLENMSSVNFAANRMKVSYGGRGPRGSEVLMLSLERKL